MVTKYRGLRIIKWVLRVIGGLWFTGGIAVGLILMFTPTPVIDYVNGTVTMNGAPAVGLGIGTILGSIVIAILLEGFAELLNVLMDTEENTRLQTMLLKQLIRNQSKPTVAPKSAPKSLLDTEPEF